MKGSKPRILVVEDDAAVARGIVDYLDARGFDSEHAGTLDAARRAVACDEFAVIVLDWMLPDGEGIDLVRERSPRCPVIFLTARTELADRVVGLEVGADDYIVKPFEPRELLARIHVQLRRREPVRVHQTGPFSIDLQRRQVSYRGTPIVLTKLEFDLLHLLVRESGRVFSREELLNQVW